MSARRRSGHRSCVGGFRAWVPVVDPARALELACRAGTEPTTAGSRSLLRVGVRTWTLWCVCWGRSHRLLDGPGGCGRSPGRS